MSVNAATGSPNSYSAVAQLLADGLTNATNEGVGSPTGRTGGAGSLASSSRNPSDSVNLSAHAKAVLAQAQQDQAAADQLQALVQSNRNFGAIGKDSVPGQSTPSQSTSAQTASSTAPTFDQLTGQTQSQQGSSANLDDALYAYTKALDDANRQSDGKIASFSQTLDDVVGTAPSTPEEIASWYQSTEGQQVLGAAQFWPENDPGLAEALTSHSVTFLNASDIPDLNFHNTISIQGGEGGNSIGNVYTYNRNAAIFSDPSTSYKVLEDGTVLSWKTPPASGTAASS